MENIIATMDGITRYYSGGREVSAFEMNALTHMAETKKTLDAILKELRKLNKSLTPSP